MDMSTASQQQRCYAASIDNVELTFREEYVVSFAP